MMRIALVDPGGPLVLAAGEFSVRDGAPLAFAGPRERWTVPEGSAPMGSLFGSEPGNPVETYTILTTAANETVAPVHGRMPIILPCGAYGVWLAGDDIPLAPCPADDLIAYPVSTLVNSSANDDLRCVKPISLARSPATVPDLADRSG